MSKSWILGMAACLLVAAGCGTSPCDTLSEQCAQCTDDATTVEGGKKIACDIIVQAGVDDVCQQALDSKAYENACKGAGDTGDGGGGGGT